METWDSWLGAIKSKSNIPLLDLEATNLLKLSNDGTNLITSLQNKLGETNIATSQLYIQGQAPNEFMQFAYLRYDVSDEHTKTLNQLMQFKHNDIKVDALDFLNFREMQMADAKYHEMVKEKGLKGTILMKTEDVLDNDAIIDTIQSTAVELKTQGKLSENTINTLQQLKDEHWAIAASTEDWKYFTTTEWHFVLEQSKSKSLSFYILSHLLQTLLTQYYQLHKVTLVKRSGLPTELQLFVQCILNCGQITTLEPSKFREVVTNMHLELCPQPLGLNVEQEIVKQYSNKFRQ